jgi:poly-gamma-glutamate synthesis protein (capsule biosynthesis protein)
MDFGPVGLRDTLDHARAAHFPLVGSGLDDREAFAPYRVTVHGNRVAVLAATQVLDDNLAAQGSAGPEHAGLASAKNPERLVAAVRSARQSSDTVIVYLHWGQERMSCPTRAQQDLAGQLVGAGADIVVGSHAHVQLAGGWYAREGQHGGLHGGQAAYVDYGLGNFVFYASGTGPQTRAGVLLLTVAGRTVRDAQWLPATVQGGVPVPVPASRAAAAVHMWDSLRACTSLSATPPPQDDS